MATTSDEVDNRLQPALRELFSRVVALLRLRGGQCPQAMVAPVAAGTRLFAVPRWTRECLSGLPDRIALAARRASTARKEALKP